MYTNDNTIFSLLEMPQPEIPPNPEDEPQVLYSLLVITLPCCLKFQNKSLLNFDSALHLSPPFSPGLTVHFGQIWTQQWLVSWRRSSEPRKPG